jgi:type IV pilus assembly protein PilW
MTRINRLHAGQLGRTLIELIIAVAIGMVILIGVGALYLSSSGVSRLANQAGSAEDAGRLLMTMVGEGIKAGGYGEIVGSDYSAQGQTLFDGPVVVGCTGDRLTDPFNAGAPNYACNAVAAPGDQVLFRFQGEYVITPMDAATRTATTVPDCLGGLGAAQNEIFNPLTPRAGAGTTRRMIQSAFYLNAAGNTLMCEGNSNPGAPAPIVNDVIDFTVFYRFDDGGWALAAGSSTNYSPVGGTIRNAAFVNGLAGAAPTDPWNYVVGVIVCLTVGSREQGTSIQANNPNATRCPRTTAEAAAGAPVTEASADGRVRRTFIEMFTIRSQATGAPSIAL